MTIGALASGKANALTPVTAARSERLTLRNAASAISIQWRALAADCARGLPRPEAVAIEGLAQ